MSILLRNEKLQHLGSVTHEGKLLVVATNGDGSLWYSIKQDGFEDSYLNTPAAQRSGWEDWKTLELPDEDDDQSVIEQERAELTYQDEADRYLLRSRYRTRSVSAVAPVQLVSALGHVYVFRQSVDATLVVDRFVLDGMTNDLKRKLQVRYKRSRQKNQPTQSMGKGVNGLVDVDSLDFSDANNNFFYEPSTELSLIDNLHAGWFAVVLVPTTESDVYRWHVFAYHRQTRKIGITTLRASEEGLFAIRDYTAYDAASGGARPVPGIIRRSLDVDGATVTNGLAATRYDLQQEQVTQSGETQLVKTASRVMLAVPTSSGTAAFSFAIAADGTLADIADNPSHRSLRSKQHEVLLPLNTLDEIRAYADASPPPKGLIKGLANGSRETAEDRVQVLTSDGAAAELADGDLVKISATKSWRGLHRVGRDVDATSFDIDLPVHGALGNWEKQEEVEAGLVFDGMITAYEATGDGSLRVTCRNHGLNPGDEVQILGTDSQDGIYPVQRIDDAHFVIDRPWDAGEAVNVRLLSRKRRGLVLDGTDDHVQIANSDAVTFAVNRDFSIEAWVKVETQAIDAAFKDVISKARNNKTFGYTCFVRYLPASRNFLAGLYDGTTETTVLSATTVDDDEFHHVAFVKQGSQLFLLVDGDVAKGGTAQVGAVARETRQITTTDGALYLGCRSSRNNFFKGQVAELRLWKTARSADDIRNCMAVSLTGMESGLAGYWRLGTVADDKVVDLSVYRGDGTVHGDAYVSATRLARRLADGAPAVKYRNPELVAVSRGATYEESLEFRMQPPAVPPAAGIFAFVHWGRASRSSDDEIAPAGPGSQDPPVDLGGGWYRASARVTIGDGVALLRSFELKVLADQGDWDAIEVRRHRIHLLSDSVTEAAADKTLTLQVLADDDAGSALVLRDLESKEFQQAALQVERRLLQDKLDGLKDLEQAKTRLATVTADAERLRLEVAAAKASHEREQASPLNYWCRIRSGLAGDRFWTHVDLRNGDCEVYLLTQAETGTPQRQQWKFVRTADGACQIEGRFDASKACTAGISSSWMVHAGVLVAAKGSGRQDQAWKLSAVDAGYTIESTLTKGAQCRSFQPDAYPRVALQLVDAANDLAKAAGTWSVETVGNEATNDTIERAKSDWNAKAAQWTATETQRKALDDIVTNGVANKSKWDTRLKAVNAELDGLQKPGSGTLAVLNSAFLGAVASANQRSAALAMPGFEDGRGLATQAAMLAFVRPASRLTALATCEGNVQLSYFDTRGRMRQTLYDAAADSMNATAEQWLPDAQRACLNIGAAQDFVSVDVESTQDWTIEAWFWYPLPEATWNTLVRGETSHHVLVDKQGRLGIYRDGHFSDGGFDMNRLSHGWHHLAAVGVGDNTLFHVDGRQVGDTRSMQEVALKSVQAALANNPAAAKQATDEIKIRKLKVVDKIVALGNQPGGGQPFGKLAEVRIWGIALSDEEIAVNSKTLLSGNEPGLLAYFPLDEATGTEVRDRTGNPKRGTLKGAPQWWACSACIGNPGHGVAQFDGVEQCIEVPYANALNPERFTLSCWVRVTGGKGTWRSVVTSRNIAPTRGYILYAGQNDKWQFWIGNGGAGSWVTCTGPDVVPYRWTHLAASYDGHTLTLYVDGVVAASVAATLAPNAGAKGRPLRIGAGTTETSVSRYCFAGQIAEVCLWNRARTPDDVVAAMHGRVAVGEDGLVARYPLDQIGTDQKATDLVGGQHGSVVKATAVDDNTLPLAGDALLSDEYSTVSQARVAIMRRFLGYPGRGGAELLPDKRIEALELKWLGNAQFAPTLLGYIEGAPPVPSENLTMADDYNGAASVELTTSEDVEFSWTRSQDSGLGASIDAFLGGGGKVSFVATAFGVGTEIQTAAKAGFKGNLDFSYQFQNETNITSSSSLAMTDRLELRGTPEETARFPHLGNRFIPKNVGYALVVSALADVFITRLTRSKKMIGYRVQPVEGIPPDVNTVTFMMNPAYTMNGSLDGLTGSSATSERFFKQVPDMRAQYGSLYPASYYRLREAYDLKMQIEKADKQRESYFSNFNVRLLDETSLSQSIDKGDAPAPVVVNQDVDTNKPAADPSKEAKDFVADAKAAAGKTGDAAKLKQEEIRTQIDDLEKRSHATASFAGWQTKMEDIRIRAGKRNIVNNYVWDADGGLRSETESFANTVEHSIGGSFSLNAGLGVQAEFEAGVDVELTAQATVNLTQTMSKTEARSKGLELAVDLGGLEFRGITDYKDNPILPGEKVDRYRFMSFYLEGSDRNFQDFFNEVVDPEWLASNDEEARALRQAQAGKSNKAWRVLHRVTYVERPALMGFGRARRTMTAAETSDYQLLLDKISKLEETLAKLVDFKRQ